MATVVLTRSQVFIPPTALSPRESAAIRLIHKDLSFRKKDYWFSAQYQLRRWDGYYRLYNKDKNTYRTGLLARTLPAWIHNGFKVEDRRDLPALQIDDALLQCGGYRDYQQDAVRAVFNNKVGLYWLPRGIIHLPPRSGKTMIAAALIAQFRARPAVFVVERVDLAWQSAAALSKVLCEEVGVVGDGSTNIKPVTVITIQSLHAAFNIAYEKIDHLEAVEQKMMRKHDVVTMLVNAQVIITDESHHCSAPGYQHALGKAENAWAVIGLSGTPWMDDGSDLLLENAIGPVIFHRTYSWMINHGYLLPLDIYFYNLPKILCYSGNYASVYKAAVVDNPIKTFIICKTAKSLMAQGKSVAILTVQKRHARDIAAQLPGAVVLTGEETGRYRHGVYQRLHRKELLCIVSTVFSEGIDVPSLNAGINADGGQDSRRIFQRLRMQTPCENKKRGIYIDFIHEEKHLEKHSKRRMAFYQSEPGFHVHVRDTRAIMRYQFRHLGYLA